MNGGDNKNKMSYVTLAGRLDYFEYYVIARMTEGQSNDALQL